MLKIAWIFGCFYPFWGLIFNFFEYFQHFCQILCMIAHRLSWKSEVSKKVRGWVSLILRYFAKVAVLLSGLRKLLNHTLTRHFLSRKFHWFMMIMVNFTCENCFKVAGWVGVLGIFGKVACYFETIFWFWGGWVKKGVFFSK